MPRATSVACNPEIVVKGDAVHVECVPCGWSSAATIETAADIQCAHLDETGNILTDYFRRVRKDSPDAS